MSEGTEERHMHTSKRQSPTVWKCSCEQDFRELTRTLTRTHRDREHQQTPYDRRLNMKRTRQERTVTSRGVYWKRQHMRQMHRTAIGELSEKAQFSSVQLQVGRERAVGGRRLSDAEGSPQCVFRRDASGAATSPAAALFRLPRSSSRCHTRGRWLQKQNAENRLIGSHERQAKASKYE